MGALTDKFIKTAPPGRHGDGAGLFLVVSPAGAKKWVCRYQLNGVRRDMGLGSYPMVSLVQARLAAAEAQRTKAAGQDPIALRRISRASSLPLPTFAEVAETVAKETLARRQNPKAQNQIKRLLGPVCEPLLKRPVNEITTLEIADALRPVWSKTPETARKAYPLIRRVFEHARILLRDRYGVTLAGNPAAWTDLQALGFEAPAKLTRGHQPSLAWTELPSFIAELRASPAISARALEFLILTNVRTDAVLHARFDDFDLKQALWLVPVVHLKDKRTRREPFRVPLSPRVLEIVQDCARLRVSDYLFPGAKDKKPLSSMALVMLLRKMNAARALARKPLYLDPIQKRPIVPHGFRSTFRVWAEEQTNFPHAVVEQCMGHAVGNEVERAYRRTDILDKRRELMNAWSAFACSGFQVVRPEEGG